MNHAPEKDAVKDTVLEIKEFTARFLSNHGNITAVDKVNLSIRDAEITGIVGESGCGKSALAQSILRLLDHSARMEYSGEINFENKNLLSLPPSALRGIRGGRISMIFQDPLTSLNPVYKVGSQIKEALAAHRKLSGAEAKKRAVELLDEVGIAQPEKRFFSYPHELSGGMRQRVMIAMALSCEPRILIADEPTTALDVTIQAQILKLIKAFNRKNGMAALFISHDLGVIAEICDTVRVMYMGRIVESAPSAALFREPLHPYTCGLIQSIPRLNSDKGRDLPVIPGGVPSFTNVPAGCRFAERCLYAQSRCHAEEPRLENVGPGRGVKCWRYAKSTARGGEGGLPAAGAKAARV
jgi:oligopeptide/dipeptide ABC transporter ATP-binding protein